MDLRSLATGKIGPFPGYVWLLLVGGAGYLWFTTHPSSAAADQTATDGGQPSGTYAPAGLGGLPDAFLSQPPAGGSGDHDPSGVNPGTHHIYPVRDGRIE